MPLSIVFLRPQNWSRLKPNYQSTTTAVEVNLNFYLSLTSVCLDFTSFKPLFYLNLTSAQPAISKHGWETTVYRPLGIVNLKNPFRLF